MKNFIYLSVFTLLCGQVIAQELPAVDVPGMPTFDVSVPMPEAPTDPLAMPEVSVAVDVPAVNPIPAAPAPASVASDNSTSAEPSAFDNMMETLFGDSSLPAPQGSLANEVEPPAPLFSDAPIAAPVGMAPPVMPMVDTGIVPPNSVVVNPGMMAPAPVQPIIAAAPAPARPIVGNFDIAGIKLKMTPKEVFEQAVDHGYKPEYVDKTPANFVKWRLERQCMDDGVYIYERKQECVKENAKKTGDYYINYMEFTKANSREKLRTFFTSSFSGNKLYRVTYYNEGDNSLGDTVASTYIKDKRKVEFYNWIAKKYGQPTNPAAMVWGDGGDAPYFQAFTSGSSVNFNLTLEAPMMPYEDSQAMKKADVKSVTYSEFSF